MPYTADMNRCTGPKDWAQARGIQTVGCRHACKLGPPGMLHPQCSERRSCHLEAQEGRNVYTSRRVSGWTHRQVHTCVACEQEFESEHRAAFHLCPGPKLERGGVLPLDYRQHLESQDPEKRRRWLEGEWDTLTGDPAWHEAWDKLLRCPWDDWKPGRDVA